MERKKMNELNLGTGKIGGLIRKFSIPCVISMVVAALYNIVDQIFIGWSEAGAYGNAATIIVYPLTVLALGLALLIGDGAAAQFSIALGKNDTKQANKDIGNGFVILIGLAVVLCIIAFHRCDYFCSGIRDHCHDFKEYCNDALGSRYFGCDCICGWFLVYIDRDS